MYYEQFLDPTAVWLRDVAGNRVWTKYEYEGPNGAYKSTLHVFLDNCTGQPSLERTTVDGDRLTLTFDDALDDASAPEASTFAVKVNGSLVSLAANPVDVTGANITLDLASAVAPDDDVTVSYEKPTTTWQQNVLCKYGKNFSDVSAMNLTGGTE